MIYIIIIIIIYKMYVYPGLVWLINVALKINNKYVCKI